MLGAKEAAKQLGKSLPQFNRYKIKPDTWVVYRNNKKVRLFAEESISEFKEELLEPDDEGINMEQICERYGVDCKVAYKWIVMRYDLPALRTLGRKAYYRKSDVDRVAKDLCWLLNRKGDE